MARYLTIDEFMKQGFENSSENMAYAASEDVNIKTKRKKVHSDGSSMKKMKCQKSSSSLKKKGTDSDSELDAGYEDYQSTLANLKDKDPEFFQYLSQNDQNLLNFNISDSDSDKSEDDEVPEKNEKFHEPSGNLQVASDESDYSDNETQGNDQEPNSVKTVVTASLIAEWKSQLEAKPKLHVLKSVMLAFRAAVEQASDGMAVSMTPFLVKGTTAFNSVIRLCLTNLLPALHRLLGLPQPTQVASSHNRPDLNPKKSKSWSKINTALRAYLTDIIKMLTVVVESDIIIVFLRHVLHWVPYYIQYPKLSRQLLKKLVTLWSTSEESIRVLAFICIIRLLRVLPNAYLDYFLKQMYLSYVSNCKFTSPTTWPLINFMKRSLVELYSLDLNVAYQHAFVYIRQLAIHLRNAMTTRKKDSYQVVYNWQYIHCILLWSHLLAEIQPSPLLSPLLYPLVQVILGVVNLIQTAKYLPLRFHLICALTKLSAETDTFIQVLPLILQIFEIVDINKGHSSLSLKPMDFSCILKLSKSQLQENAFHDGCVNQFYELLMDYLNAISHVIGYPELVFPAAVQIKAFLKSCKVGNYSRKIKQVVDKMEENSKFITERRNTVNFAVSDLKAVDEWEKHIKEAGTPITKFYVTWRKLRDHEILQTIAKKDQDKELKLPKVERKLLFETKREDQAEFSELFASGSEDDETEYFLKAIDKAEKSNEKKKKL